MEQNRGYRAFATVLETIDDRNVLRVFGDIDISCNADFEEAIDDAAASGALVILDLRECQYMDSTGLTAVVRAVKRYGDRIEAMVSEGSSVCRVMQITDFQTLLPITIMKSAALGEPRLAG